MLADQSEIALSVDEAARFVEALDQPDPETVARLREVNQPAAELLGRGGEGLELRRGQPPPRHPHASEPSIGRLVQGEDAWAAISVGEIVEGCECHGWLQSLVEGERGASLLTPGSLLGPPSQA